MLRFQQAGLTVNKVKWENWNPEEEQNTTDAKPLEISNILSSKVFCDDKF